MKDKEQIYEIGDVVVTEDRKNKISVITGVKREVFEDTVCYKFQLDEDDTKWLTSAFIEPFVDRRMLERIVKWLKANLGNYGYSYIPDAVGKNKIDLFDAIRLRYFMKNTDGEE